MLDINERLRSYEPLWDGWKKDAYLGGNSSSASFLMKLDAPEGRKYSLAIVLPMISFRDMPEDRSEREAYIEQKKAAAANNVKSLYSLRGKPHIAQCLAHCTKNVFDDNGALIGFDLIIQTEHYGSLRKYMDDNGTLTERAVDILALHIAAALKALHSENRVHGNMSPDCILIDRGGSYILGGVGLLAKAQSSTAVPSAFTAPELWNAEGTAKAATPSSDIYSFGLTLYYLLNGNTLPLVPAAASLAEEEEAVSGRLGGRTFPAPSFGSDKMKAIVMKCCAYDPENRFEDIDELIEALNSPVYPIPDEDDEEEGKGEGEDADISDIKYNSRLKTLALLIFAVLIIFMTAMILIMLHIYRKEHTADSNSPESGLSVPDESGADSIPGSTTTTTVTTTTTTTVTTRDPKELYIPPKVEYVSTKYTYNGGTSITSIEMRTAPGDEGIVIENANIPTGKSVDIYAEELDTKTLDTWAYLTYSGKTGWVNEKYLSKVLVPDSYSYKKTMFVNTQDDDLTIWTGPGYTYTGFAIIPMHDDVDIYAETYVAASSETWCYICYKDEWGWVNKKYLEELSEKDKPDDESKGDSSEDDEPPPFEPGEFYSNYEFRYASASSTLGSEIVRGHIQSYYASNAADNDFSTCWCEGEDGDGIGESIKLRSSNEVTIDTIYIANGILTSETSFYNNNRVKDCTIEFSDGSSIDVTLNDGYSQQPVRIDLPEPVSTRTITLTINSVYKGLEYSDTCISEIAAYNHYHIYDFDF